MKRTIIIIGGENRKNNQKRDFDNERMRTCPARRRVQFRDILIQDFKGTFLMSICVPTSHTDIAGR